MAEIKNKYLRPFKNKYLIISVGFIIWMLFFDTNSWFIHHELNIEKENSVNEKEYYKKGIQKDNKEIKELSTKNGLEKFAREEYYMKRENEEIFIIEYTDSLKTAKNE